jgi:Tfp pilus assembly protein FimT
MVIVILGILSVVAVERMSSPAAMTLRSQAQQLANDIDRAKTLAYTSGQHVQFRISTSGANGTYDALTCTVVNGSGVGTTCPTTVVGPVTLQKGVIVAGPATLDLNSLGQPTAAATYTLSCPSPCTSATNITVAVATVTGAVTVTP